MFTWRVCISIFSFTLLSCSVHGMVLHYIIKHHIILYVPNFMITVWGFISVMAIATVLVMSMAMPAKGMQMNRFDRYKQNI